MKAKLILIIVMLIITCSSIAQRRYKPGRVPRWVSDKGFWQIESNINAPSRNIVYFYNNNRELVYKENVDGVLFNLAKKRVKMRLKRALETALVAWSKEHTPQSNQQWVTGLFKK